MDTVNLITLEIDVFAFINDKRLKKRTNPSQERAVLISQEKDCAK
jgi:hypothetical protein